MAFDPKMRIEQTPMFKVRNVDLNSQIDKNSMDQTNPPAKPEPDNAQDQQPDQKKSFDKLLQDIQASAVIPDEVDNVLEKPQAPDAAAMLSEIDRGPAQMLSNAPNATHEQSAFNDSATSGRPLPMPGTELATSTTIKRPNTFSSKVPGDSAGPNKNRSPGFSDLDQLLNQKGPLGSGTQLRMPDDQLFQYDSADLQPSAISQLQKLAVLIKRNPKATFTVEGYTDSFGSPEYNLDLSQRRADSVKQYLVSMMGISPDQVQTRGYGQTKFLVQPNPNVGPAQPDMDAEIRRQQPNRRVIIVVHTKEG
jgi:outer membrane protein OmpA-like peptidoglycan-associated protein